MPIRLAALALLSLAALTAAQAQPRQPAAYLPLVAAPSPRPGAWLAGTWASDLAVYRFDLAALAQTRTAFGLTDTRPMTILSETAERVVYHTGAPAEPVTAERLGERTLRLSQPGRVPVELTRQE